MLQDLKFAVRSLSRRPGFLAVVVLTLGLGIGANATVFSVVNGVLLQPLPYRAPERLAVLWHEFGEGAQFLPALHPLDYRDYAERSRLFEDFTIATGREWILGGDEQPELVDVGLVEANFFPFLGVDPILGRHFLAEEAPAGGPKVVMLGHEVWQRRFGGDPGIVGRTVVLEDEAHEVVGVLPEGFRLLLPAEAFRLRHSQVWRPAQIDYSRLPPRNFTGFTVFGRIRPDVTFAQAQEEMNALAAQLRREHAVHAASNLRAHVVPFQHDVVKGARRGLLILEAAVGFVLLIACANVAQLLLTRGRGREGELMVRAAVGAGRWPLGRLILAESLAIAVAGALLGVALSHGGLALVRHLAAVSVPRLHSVEIDLGVLAFVTVVSVAAAVTLGIVPAIQAARTDLSTGLKERAARSSSPRSNRVRDALVVAQVAVSLILVVGAGLMIQSFRSLARVHPGFEPGGALTARVSLPPDEYRDWRAERAYLELRARLSGLPGVTSLGAVSQLPLSGRGPLQPYAYDEETARNWESVSADHLFVSPGWFEAIGATLVAGRDFSPEELEREEGDPRRIVIDDTLARRAFPGRDPVGEHLQLEPDGGPDAFGEVIGVVEHLKLHDLSRTMLPQIYEPAVWGRFSLTLRTNGRPEALASELTGRIKAQNPGIVVEDVRPMSDLVGAAMGQMRLAVSLMSGFGALAILLAAVGIYGVFSYSVSQRSREIAIRMALGDAPSGIRRLVLGHGLRVVGLSLFLGILGAGLLSRFVAALLYEIDPLDPPTYAASTVFLAAVGLLACWIPAERAARVEPLLALREE